MREKNSIIISNSVSKEDWNEFVLKNEFGNIFQTMEMAEVYNKSKGDKALTLAAINEDTNEILATLVTRKRMEKTGFLSSLSAHSTIRGGPIFVNNDMGIKAASILLQHNDDTMKKETIYGRIYPVYNLPKLLPCFKENNYESGPWYNIFINLNRPIDEIWQNINKKNRRYGIRKATKCGVEINEISDKKLLPVFYNLMLEKYKSRKSEIHSNLEDLDFFEMVFDILVQKKMAKFYLAEHNGRYIAGLLVLFYKEMAHAWYGGSSKRKEDLLLYPNDLIVWHTIEYAHKNGFALYDFMGAGESEKMLSGPNKFKKEFGSYLESSGRFIKVYSPNKLWFIREAFKIYRMLKIN